MARFNAAVMDGAADAKFQNRYNYLLDLLDTAYIVEKRIDGKSSRVEVSPQNGLLISYDGESLFSVSPTTGEVIIGKYDDAITAAITTAETESKNALAQQLGYDDYADMVAEATLGNTVISGGYINTDLIEAGTIIFDKLATAAVTSINDLIAVGGRNRLAAGNILSTTPSFTLDADGYLVPSSTVTDDRASNYASCNWQIALPAGTYMITAYTDTATANASHYAAVWDSAGTVLVAATWKPCLTVGKSTKSFTLASAATVGFQIKVYDADVKVKLEAGNKATDWTPAPEDKLTEGITYAGVKIDATNGFVSTATIGGNTIQTKANATDGFAIYNGADKVFGVSTDGYVYANRLYDPDDEYSYIQIGADPDTSDASLLTFYQATAGYTTPRKRLFIKTYGTTGVTIEGVPRDGTGDVEGSAFLSMAHGNAYLLLQGTDTSAYIKMGGNNGSAEFTGYESNAFTEKAYFVNSDWTMGVDPNGPYAVNRAGDTTTHRLVLPLDFVYSSVATNATVSPQLGDYQVGIVCVVWYGAVNTSAYYMVHSWASGARYFQQLGTTQGDAAPAATAPVLNADGTFTIKNDHDTYALTISVKFIKFF